MPDGPRVLLVDDDPAMLRLLEVNFRLEGFVVRTASRGEEAVASIMDDPPDAVVLDVMMPGLDGYQVAARVREDPALASLPIVFLTARVLDEERDQGAGLDDVEFMTKPFDPADLVLAVRRGLSRGGA